MNPAIIDGFGFGRRQTAQRLVQNAVELRLGRADRQSQIVLVRGNTGNPQVRQTEPCHRVAYRRDMRHHHIQIAVGKRKQPVFHGLLGIEVEIRMIDQQIVMTGLAVYHADPLIPKFTQVSDKATGVADRQRNGHVDIGPGEQEFLLGTRRAGHAGKHVQLTGFQFFLGAGPTVYRHSLEANPQILLQPAEQVGDQPRGPAILFKLERRPVRPQSDGNLRVTGQPFQFTGGQGHVSGLDFGQLPRQPGLANIAMFLMGQ